MNAVLAHRTVFASPVCALVHAHCVGTLFFSSNSSRQLRCYGASYAATPVLMWHLLLSIGLPQPVSTTRRLIPFPRGVLRKFLDDKERAVPGTRIDSPGFDMAGYYWQVTLYPFGGNADPTYAGRVGVYLKLLQPGGDGRIPAEVDTSFEMTLNVLRADALAAAETEADAEAREAARRGTVFRCGMTFCPASEAGESSGRCEDWGAHVYPTSLLLKELEDEACVAAVDLELSVWGQRPCRPTAGLGALVAQVRRLPRGSLRVGEVVVALGQGGSSPTAAGSSSGGFQFEPGVEYRIMRLESEEGSSMFELAPPHSAGGVAYLLPTSRTARGAGTFSELFYSNEALMAQRLGAEADMEAEQSWREPSLEGSDRVRAPGAPKWPVAVKIASLPPIASRLGFRALPARLGFAARYRSRLLLLFVVVGASPLWGGFLLSQLGSAYVIPSRSMEATLSVGDVVLGEKVSRLANLPFEVDDLVLFSPPAELRKIVEEAGSKPLGSRDLFVKRVAALAGDTVELLADGAIAINGEPRKAPPLQCSEGAGAQQRSRGAVSRVIPKGQVFVLGDCPARSTDSRTWGPLPVENVVARPVLRVWPLDRRGAIDASRDLNPFVRPSKVRASSE